MSDLEEERERTDLIRNRGKENGLFRACMDRIKEQHHYGQLLRQAFIVLGIFTDKLCYTELLTQFYICTKTLEKYVHEKEIPSAEKISSAYRFTDGYEEDLKQLLGKDRWETQVHDLISDAAREYVALLETLCGDTNGEDREAAMIGGTHHFKTYTQSNLLCFKSTFGIHSSG